jgi:hypothetical protein
MHKARYISHRQGRKSAIAQREMKRIAKEQDRMGRLGLE